MGNPQGWGFNFYDDDESVASHIYAAFAPDLKGEPEISHTSLGEMLMLCYRTQRSVYRAVQALSYGRRRSLGSRGDRDEKGMEV